MKANKEAYEVGTDELIYDAKHPIDAKVVPLTVSSVTSVARGQVVDLTSAGTYVLHGSTLESGVTAKANGIVANEITCEETDTSVNVTIYVSGSFRDDELTGTLVDADKEALRDAGIYLK